MGRSKMRCKSHIKLSATFVIKKINRFYEDFLKPLIILRGYAFEKKENEPRDFIFKTVSYPFSCSFVLSWPEILICNTI